MSDEKIKLQKIIGCRIKTHYNTGGIVTRISGPHGNFYTLNYEDPRDRHICNIIQLS